MAFALTSREVPTGEILDILFRVNQPPILLGTSSFTATGWDGSFYPKGMPSADYLAFHAERWHTVDVDPTFYGCPSARTVSNWAARTPEGFIFSVKVLQVITHEKALVDCDAEFREFVETMSILGPNSARWSFSSPYSTNGKSRIATRSPTDLSRF